MVGGKRRKSAQRKLLGSHQKSWLYGRHAVLESLRAGRWTPREVWIATDLEPDVRREANTAASRLGIELVESDPDTMTRRCGGLAHQGLMALMPPFPYTDCDSLLNANLRDPFYIVLDGIQDPFNFGAILRSADVFGANGVFVSATNQCDVTVQVARSSAGAVNYVPIAQTSDLTALLSNFRTRSIRCIAAAGTARQSLTELNLTGPTALLIGNEGVGVRDDLLAACDQTARIPQFGHVDSLNAAVAAGILCYEVQRQRAAVNE